MTSAESPSPAGAEQNKGRPDCPHPVWVTHIKGGEPLSVDICSLCNEINWKELRKDFEERVGLLLSVRLPENQTDPESVNLCEGPEDAARRYAGQLMQLQEGLKARGWDLSTVTEEGVVELALSALDQRDADARANAEIANNPPPRRYINKEGLF